MTEATAVYATLGCKLNFAETATVARLLADKGISRAVAGTQPRICVVNTCSVTAEADRKCRHLIRSLSNKYPGASIIVTGCYAQLKPAEVAALPGVDVVVGINDKLRIADIAADLIAGQRPEEASQPIPHSSTLREFMPACSRGDRTRYFLKVQDGCDYWCSYCTIPAARGRSRSATIAQITEQARRVAAEGGKEIVITGVNIGDFGKGRDDTFLDLCRELDLVDGIERYRISSIEPNLLTDELIEFVAGSRRFMPHFHVPLQAGCDEVLRTMRRHYDTALFAAKMERIRALVPHAFIGVDLIVGARGEDNGLFARSKAFVESLPISRLHVFPYSERPGTRALELPGVVTPEQKRARMEQMLEVSAQKLARFSTAYAGTVRPVLIEHVNHGVTAGFTDNYLRVELPERHPELANRVVPLRLNALSADGQKFTGELAL